MLAVDADPRLPYAALAAVVFVETLVDSVPGIVLWLGTRLLAPDYYLAVGRPWGRSPLDDQKFGGVMLWAIGEVVGLPLLIVVVVQWMRADAREAARIDAELDRAELDRAARDGPDHPLHEHATVCYKCSMGVRVAVAGASGYAGGELLRLVLSHPGLELGALCASSAAGRPVLELHPGLLELAGEAFATTDPALLADADLVFLALPHGESAGVVAQLPAGLPVVDLGADFRLADPAAWTTYYGTEHAHAGTWTYGLPELPGARERVAGSRRVANPGCYATAVELGLAPLLGADLVEPTDVVVVAASGTTGAGRKAVDALLASTVMGAVGAYKTGGVHQHTPEMEQALVRCRRAAGHPVVHADAGPDAARHPRHLHRPVARGVGHRGARRGDAVGVRVRAVRARAAGRPVADHQGDERDEQRRRAGGRRPARRPRRRVGRAWTTWGRARPGRRCRTPTSSSGWPRPPG